MGSLAEFRDFSFTYRGGRPGLMDISFRIAQGEWLSIIGPNGSGKSTLLKSMLRLNQGRTSGKLLIAGRAISTFRQIDLARLFAYLPQPGGIVPPFTAREFLSLSRYSFREIRDSRLAAGADAIEHAFALTNTGHLADRRLDRISGGQRQRVFLAAALVQETEALLLDEPASFLDPKNSTEIHELLQRLHFEKGLTVITVTHDLTRALSAGAKALVLREGRQIFFGESVNLEENACLEQAFSFQFSYLKHPRTGETLVIS